MKPWWCWCVLVVELGCVGDGGAGAGSAGAGGGRAGGVGAGGAGAGGAGAGGARPTAPKITGCTYITFMKCDPQPFKGTEGAVGLCQWFEKLESVFRISDFKERDKVKFATATLQGCALTWWNGRIASMGINAANGTSWTSKMVEPEQVKVERIFRGLSKNIRGDVTSSRPAGIDEAIRMAYQLMGQLIQGKMMRFWKLVQSAELEALLGIVGNVVSVVSWGTRYCLLEPATEKDVIILFAMKRVTEREIAQLNKNGQVELDTCYKVKLAGWKKVDFDFILGMIGVNSRYDAAMFVWRVKVRNSPGRGIFPEELPGLSPPRNKEEHGEHLKTILNLLRSEKLYAKFSKCDFWLDSVQFLGHVIDSSGVHVDPP
ncbi:hypothetical protein Tco_1183119 [Tanacetum coccineum]